MTSALEHIISPASHYRTTELESCVAFFGIQTADIYVLLAPLKAVVDCSNGKDILYLHASLPDFLFDKERSREYYINPVTWSTRLSVMAFKFLEAGGIAGKHIRVVFKYKTLFFILYTLKRLFLRTCTLSKQKSRMN